MNDVTNIEHDGRCGRAPSEHDAGEEQEFPVARPVVRAAGTVAVVDHADVAGPVPAGGTAAGAARRRRARWRVRPLVARRALVGGVDGAHLPSAQRTFPPCWPQHPALFEEMAALWAFWQDGLTGVDASRPVQFLDQLARSIDRCQRYWKVPCDPQTHKPATGPARGAGAGHPDLHRWWGNDNYRTDWRIR